MQSVSLVEATPDHRHLRCVVGVWNRAASGDTLAVFRGSTVPGAPLVQSYANAGTPRSNMRLCGYYWMKVGTHVGSSDVPVPGAWVHHGRIPVVRSRVDPVYGRNDPVLALDRADNLHCAWSRRLGASIEFSSAGCLTVFGSYDSARKEHLDPVNEKGWSTFRVRAGLTPTRYTAGLTTSPPDGTLFPLVLLTGREARLAAAGTGPTRRLRFGSAHEAVTRLQQKLGVAGAAAGVMDFATVDRLTTWQREQLGDRDGILEPGDLGLDW